MSLRNQPILLIEDDASLSESLRVFFEDAGYRTRTAITRQAGEALLRSLDAGVCLLDLNLPDGSGIDLLRLITAEEIKVKVIVMTAFPIQKLQDRFGPVVAAVLTKPVSPQHLMEWVDKIMEAN